jgi:lysophospholipase L1-like esterase
MRILRTTLALAVAVGLVSAPAAPAATTPLSLVAAGDSYASGEGAIGSGWTNAGCHRSSLAGPQDAAGRISALRSNSFVSLACSGATTGSILGQLGSLPSGRIDALSISMGGNDIGFAGIVTTCIVSDCTALDGSVSASLAALPASLAGVLNAVPSRVDNVLVTEYPDPTMSALAFCGNPVSPGFEGFDTIIEPEARWASGRVIARLNAALASAVAAANARPGPHPVFHFVRGIASRFATHGYCTGGGSPSPLVWFHPRFVATPIDSVTSQGDVRGSMHPNDLGQRAIGEALFDAERFLADRLSVRVTPAATPVVGTAVGLTLTVTTSAGTAVPRAPVTIDGQPVGSTDQSGVLTLTHTFSTPGAHPIEVDQNPFPGTTVLLDVLGKHYTVSSDPAPIPVGRAVALTLRATDSAGGLLAGTFTLTSGSGTVQIASGSTQTVTLTMRYRYEWDIGPDDKPHRVRVPVCPEIGFNPTDQAFDAKDVSDLAACQGG